MSIPAIGTRWVNPTTRATARVLDRPDQSGYFSIAVTHQGWPGEEGEWVRVADFVAVYQPAPDGATA